MLEIVAKRAALRPSDQPGSSLQLESVSLQSLPVLPPQTTINPLLQHQYSPQQQPSPSRYTPFASSRSNLTTTHHTFSSQSHNQEHDVSSNDDFLFDGTEHIYLRTNLSLLHDCEVMMEKYEKQFITLPVIAPTPTIYWPQYNAHTVLVIIEFLILYIGILCYSYLRTQ